MKSIVLIVPYFGKWPIWFEAHMVSINKNPTINWLFITDCEIPNIFPKNVEFVSMSLQELNKQINILLSLNIPLTPRKLCDLKPAYGTIFQQYIKGFDFWGFCDLDIIWGDIRKYITNDLLIKHDIITSRKNEISGHFTLFKNTNQNELLYKQENQYIDVFVSDKNLRFDEIGFTSVIEKLQKEKLINVFWKTYLLNNKNGKAHQEYFLDRWKWENGKVINTKTEEELMYLHFINWKTTMNYNEVIFDENPSHFYISYNGIHYKQHTKLKKALNRFKNKFNGYWINEKRRYRKLKFKSVKKRINHKLR